MNDSDLSVLGVLAGPYWSPSPCTVCPPRASVTYYELGSPVRIPVDCAACSLGGGLHSGIVLSNQPDSVLPLVCDLGEGKGIDLVSHGLPRGN